MTKPAAGGAFTDPTDIAGLAGWWDASDTATITDAGSGAVSEWRDKSGNARHATQGTSSSRPTTGTRSVNSLNVIDFDGGDHMDTSSFTVSQPLTVFLVVVRDSYPTYSLSSVGNNLQLGYGSGTSNIRYYAGSAEITGADGTPTAATTSQESYIINGASSASWYDGATGETGNPGSSGTTTGFRVGAERNLSGFMNGAYAEVVVYDSALGTTDRQAVEDYLQAKWGITP